MKIAVLGSGAWGTALAMLLQKNGHEVSLWSYCEEESNTLKFVRGLEYAGDDKNLLIGVDKWAGSRAE